MAENFIESIFQKQQQTAWLPVLSMLISVFGIIFLDWDFQYIIILFVWEIILMLLFALIRMVFAMNELPFYKTLIEKLVYLGLGIFIGGFFIVFSVLFISKSIQVDGIFEQIKKINYQIYLLTSGYIVGLILNYFGNQKYKLALPMLEMVSFIHVLVILAFLQLFTVHLIPNYPNLDQAVWGIVALVLVKFFVDLLFNFFQNPFIAIATRKTSYNNQKPFKKDK
jgi:hypothetical protein